MKFKNRNLFRFISIYLIAFISKVLFLISHLPFSQDQVRDVTFIRNLIDTGNWYIPLGPSTSMGTFSLPPLYYYFHLFAQKIFFKQFYSMDLFVILIESFTPILIFLLTNKITKNKFHSYAAALIYTFSYTVLSSSNAWNPNLVPFFSTLFILGFVTFIFEKKANWLLASLVSFTVLVNLHFQWFLLAPLFGYLIILATYNYKKYCKQILLFLITSLILVSPYLYGELSNGFSNSKSALQIISSDEVVFERVRKPAYITVFFSNYYQRILFGNLFTPHWGKQYDVFQPSIIIGSILFNIFLLYVIFISVKKFKNKDRKLPLYISILIFLMIFLRVYKGDKPDYYLLVFISFFPVLFSNAVISVFKNKSIFVQLIPYIVILLFQAVAIFVTPISNSYMDMKSITDQIIQISKNNKIIVEPTNQELVTPLSYFLNNEQMNLNDKNDTDYYVLICYTDQNCKGFRPNSNNKFNVYNYDHVTPQNFSYTWPGYDPTYQKIMFKGYLTALFFKVR